MERRFCFVLFGFVFVLMIVMSTGCESSMANDEPDLSDTISSGHIDEDSIGGLEDTIEPLTEYLRPALTKGKKWIRERKYDKESGEEVYLDTLFLGKDTVFLGRKCQLLVGEKYIEYFNQSFIVPYGAVSEEDGKAYFLSFDADNTDWCVMFDLNVRSADKIKAKTCTIQPLSRGTIVLMGRTRRAVKVKCLRDTQLYHGGETYTYPYDYWVEGIGMLYGHYPMSVYPPAQSTFPNDYHPIYYRLRECWDGDEKIYDYREFNDDLYTPIEVFPETNQ